MKVFLGGTCSTSTWRDILIPKLKIDYFNPVVKEWTEEDYQKELKERKLADFCLYVLTPQMVGYYSVAEIIDDAYKRNDRTLYCFLADHEGESFSEIEIEQLKDLGKKIERHGAKWLPDLDAIAEYLNPKEIESLDIKQESSYDVFISYGRRHSKEFAAEMQIWLKDQGFKVWFDQNDIPLAVDFQKEINDGILNSHNFCYVISPHSVNSIYCTKELTLALQLKKRIIPIYHVACEENKIHKDLSKLNWLNFTDKNKNQQNFIQLKELLLREASFFHHHTNILKQAHSWIDHAMPPHLLLHGKQRNSAQKWLENCIENEKNEFLSVPHVQFLSESKIEALGGYTDYFLCFAFEDSQVAKKLKHGLSHCGLTSINHKAFKGIQRKFSDHSQTAIEEATYFLFITSVAVKESKYCELAFAYAKECRKPIVQLTLDEVDLSSLGEQVNQCSLNSIAIQDYDKEDDFLSPKSLDILKTIAHQLSEAKEYRYQHKDLLCRAISWESSNRQNYYLLHHQDLEDANSWLSINTDNQRIIAPTKLQKEFIDASKAFAAKIQNDIFIIHHDDDVDFARLLSKKLTINGKIVWLSRENHHEQSYQKEITESPDIIYLSSEENHSEVEAMLKYAISLNKRIIEVKPYYLENELEHSYEKDLERKIEFKGDWANDMFELLGALDSGNKEYVQQHTFWLRLANEWQSSERNKEDLLSQTNTILAKEWLSRADEDGLNPKPNDIQRELIAASVQNIEDIKIKEIKEKTRLKQLVSSLAVLLLVAIGLGVFAYIEREKTIAAEALAKEERDEALKQKAIAEEQKGIAEAQRAKAVKAEEMARKNEAEAIRQKGIAEEEKSKALLAAELEQQAKVEEQKARKSADEAKEEAVAQMKIAVEQKRIAVEAENKAKQARDKAVIAEDKAKQARDEAVIAENKAKEARDVAVMAEKAAKKARDESQRLLNLTLARSLAKRALSYQGEMQLKLSLTAYDLYKNNYGDVQNQYLYDALYSYIEENSGEKSFNSEHAHPINNVTLSLNNQDLVATVDTAGLINVWQREAQSWNKKESIKSKRMIKSLLFAPDTEDLIALSENGSLVRFDAKNSYQKISEESFDEGNLKVLNHYFYYNNASKSYRYLQVLENSIQEKDVNSGQLFKQSLEEFNIANSTISRTGQYLATKSAKRISLYKRTDSIDLNYELLTQINIPEEFDVFVVNDQFGLITGDGLGTLTYYTHKSSWLPRNISAHKYAITKLEFNKKNDQMISSSLDGKIKIWSLTKGKIDHPISLGEENLWIRSTAYVGENEDIISLGDENLIRIYTSRVSDMANSFPLDSPRLSQKEIHSTLGLEK